jgi:ankyrin repeat protein
VQGADLDCKDKEGRSPLLVAAGNNAWTTVKELLNKGANMSATDTKSRNFLHLAILSGVNLHELGIEVFQVRWG